MKRGVLLLIVVVGHIFLYAKDDEKASLPEGGFAGRHDADTLVLTLQEAMSIANRQSLDAISAENALKTAYWRYRNYKADFLPGLTFNGTLPNLTTALSSYLREDGTYSFIRNSNVSAFGGLTLSQNLPFTGGTVSVQSQLEVIHHLDGNKKKNWLSVPVQVTLDQPLITARPLMWSRRTEPKRYSEARQQFGYNMENIALKTIQYYFDLLLSVVNNNIASQNLTNATHLYNVALSKKQMGLISDNDVSQLELGKLNAEASITTSGHDFTKKMTSLRNYLNIDESLIIIPVIPEEFPAIDIEKKEVIELAHLNHPLRFNVERRLIEIQQSIAQAKVDRGFQVNLYASLGYTGTGRELRNAYNQLEERQVVTLGVRIPILDWGKGKSRVELAKSQAEVEKTAIRQEVNNFEENVMLSYELYKDQTQLTAIARMANEVATRRYKTVFETFLLGQISILDINAAQTEEETARRNFINQLYASWMYYYSLRQITLFDFETRTFIYEPVRNMIR